MKIYVDITNLMEVNFLTGIQRVVREVLVRLVKYENMEIILLRYSPLEEEFKKLDNKNFYKYFKENNGEKSEIETEETINIASMDSGSVFLEIDSIWNASYRCSEFLPLLKDKGIKIVAYIYDIIPVTHPQFFHTNTLYNFLDYFGANIQYADALIVSTQSVLDTIYRVTDKLGIQRVPGYVSWLGSDFQVRPSEAVVSLAVAKFLEKRKKYVLIVGTIEPRKNHKILLDAFDEKLFSKDVCLVIVGKIGWNVDELEKRIRNHPQLDKRLFFFEGLNDASVSALYQDAFFVAFPTYDEGFGLPMIEAFERKVPVIASDCPVMREVGGKLAVYFETESADSFETVFEKYLDDQNEYNKLKKEIEKFVPFTWDQTTKRIADVLKKFKRTAVGEEKNIKQMVILSARVDDLCATLPFVEHFMPFIKELILCCPDGMKDQFWNTYTGNLKVRIITDSMLLEGKKLPEDHQARNFYLRSLAMKRDEVDQFFIMSDDDYRPLETIEKDFFVKDGIYQAYYCHSLRTWKGTAGKQTSYDLGMFKTLEFLDAYKYPVFQYSSHMPQVIDKNKYLEFLSLHNGVEHMGIDEWSGYFNWLQSVYPEIVRPVPYVTMCWPGALTDWKLEFPPQRYMFENFYESLYQKGEIFEGFSPQFIKDIEKENQQKKKIFEEQKKKFVQYEEVFNKYIQEYKNKYREIPSFVFMADDTLGMFFPKYMVIAFKGFFRLPITIYRKAEKRDQKLKISYFYEQDGLKLLEVKDSIVVTVNETTDLEIPLFSDRNHKGKMKLYMSAEYGGLEYKKSIEILSVDAEDYLMVNKSSEVK